MMLLLLVPPLVGFEGSLPPQEEVCNGQGCLLLASIEITVKMLDNSRAELRGGRCCQTLDNFWFVNLGRCNSAQ